MKIASQTLWKNQLMKGGEIMSEQFDALKQAADKALTEFAGGSDAIVKLVDELLKAQADDLETSFKFQEIDKLNAKISKLENRVVELNDQLSRHDK